MTRIDFDSLKQEINVLEDLGFTNTEAKVYLALLREGDSTTWDLSKKTGIHRANVYGAINKLLNKGVISHIERNNKKYYQAVNPEILLRIIDEKKYKITSILPRLKVLGKFVQESKAQIHEGAKAFMELLYKFLDYNEPILVYGIPKGAPETLKPYIMKFHKKRIGLKIKMLHIYNHNAQERIKFLNQLPYTEAKWLPTRFDSKVSTNICGDEVVLSLWQKPVWSVRIINKDIADAYKKYFYLLWDFAKK